MRTRIRPFAASDWPAFGALLDAAFPDYPGQGDHLRHEDESRPARCRAGRWLALDEAGAVGGAGNEEG